MTLAKKREPTVTDKTKQPGNETKSAGTSRPSATISRKPADTFKIHGATKVATPSGAQGASQKDATTQASADPTAGLPDLGDIKDSDELREVANWLREELVSTRIDRTEHLDHLIRIKAEFDNYRKRMLREQSNVVARAATTLVEALLPVLDSFDLALGNPPEDLADDNTFVSGLEAVQAQLQDILDKEGLERIDPESDSLFDPEVHEPVTHSPGNSDVPKVTAVLRPGYRFKGRLLRPAMVAVSG